MEFSEQIMLLMLTSAPYFLISLLQPFQNGGRSNFYGVSKTWYQLASDHKILNAKDEQR
jgi:hypothetical protein